jgi:hypothetical protein
MIKTLLMFLFLLGFASIALTRSHTLNCFAINEGQSAQSSFAGQYSGEWYATATPLALFSDGLSEHNGTWDISINSDGEVTGTEFDKTAGDKSGFKGFIGEDGNFTIFFNNSTTTVKGVLEKRGSYLTGSLRITCKSDSKQVCGTIEIRLKRNSISKNPSKSSESKVEPPLSSIRLEDQKARNSDDIATKTSTANLDQSLQILRKALGDFFADDENREALRKAMGNYLVEVKLNSGGVNIDATILRIELDGNFKLLDRGNNDDDVLNLARWVAVEANNNTTAIKKLGRQFTKEDFLPQECAYTPTYSQYMKGFIRIDSYIDFIVSVIKKYNLRR